MLCGFHGPEEVWTIAMLMTECLCSDLFRLAVKTRPCPAIPTALHWEKHIVWIIYLVTSSVLACAVSSKSTRISCEKARWNMPAHILAVAQTLPLKHTDPVLALVVTWCWQNKVCHDAFGFITDQVIVPQTPDQCKVKSPNNSFNGL